MSEEKQIEEMARDIFAPKVAIDGIDIAFAAVHGADKPDSHFMRIAQHLYNAGYRKQSENTIELPCKVGDSIYRVVKGKVKENKIEKIEIDKNTISICFDWHGMGYECCVASQIGKTVFLTREEAETKMKGGE